MVTSLLTTAIHLALPAATVVTAFAFQKQAVGRTNTESACEEDIAETFSTVRTLKRVGNSEVFVVKSSRTSQLFVVKEVEAQDTYGTDTKVKEPFEISIPRDLLRRHPNIIDIFGSTLSVDLSVYSLRMEYCTGGDLLNLIQHCKTQGRRTPEMMIMHAFIGLIDAVAYLHDGIVYGTTSNGNIDYTPSAQCKEILHRDIKPQNVFLRWNTASDTHRFNLPDIVLGDFGQCTVSGKDSMNFYGICAYYPPECRVTLTRPATNIPGRPIWTTSSDVWTIGATMHELATQEIPRYGRTPRMALDTRHIDNGVSEMIFRCLEDDPSRRPNARALVTHARKFRVLREALYSLCGPVSATCYPTEAP